MIVVEKGIPKPPPREQRGRKIYPWRDMEVGDSFFSDRVKFSNMQCTASKMGKSLGWKFEVHREKDGHRVWRIA